MYEPGIKPFKVGTKIKINEKLPLVSSFGVPPAMIKYSGKTAIITKVIPKYYFDKNEAKHYGYRINIDNEKWLWGIDMFQEIKNILELE
jgi:hypothetical protein